MFFEAPSKSQTYFFMKQMCHFFSFTPGQNELLPGLQFSPLVRESCTRFHSWVDLGAPSVRTVVRAREWDPMHIPLKVCHLAVPINFLACM